MKKIMTKIVFLLALGMSLVACRNNSENATTDAGTGTEATAEGMESTQDATSPGNNTGTASDASNTPGGGTMTDTTATPSTPTTNTP